MYVGQVNHILNSESVTTYCPFAVHGRVYVTLATIRAAQRSITTIVKLSLRGQRSLRDENFADRYFFLFLFFFFLVPVLRRKEKDLVVSRCRREQRETAREHAALATRVSWHVDSCSRQVFSLSLSAFLGIYIYLSFPLALLPRFPVTLSYDSLIIDTRPVRA